MEIIRGAAARYGGDAWSQYDVQFRHRMERDPTRSWATIDGQLWLQLMLPTQRPSRETGTFGSTTSKSQVQVRDVQLCWDFNTNGCFRSTCRFAHKCNNCGIMNHGARSCFRGPRNNKPTSSTPAPGNVMAKTAHPNKARPSQNTR